jgi:hypothetical protein
LPCLTVISVTDAEVERVNEAKTFDKRRRATLSPYARVPRRPTHHSTKSANPSLVAASLRAMTAYARALARDRHRCAHCGDSGSVEVHHIVSLRTGGDPYDLANLIALCASHHRRVEARAS